MITNRRYVKPKTPNKKRESKTHRCYYCKKPYKDQMSRHLRTAHKDEKEVKEAKQIGVEKFNNVIKHLTYLGDYNDNTTSHDDESEILVARKPNSKVIIRPKIVDKKEIWPDGCNKNEIQKDKKGRFIARINTTPEKSEKYVPCQYCYKTI